MGFLSSIVAGTASVFTGIKDYILMIVSILLVLCVIGFIFYYNHSQSEINTGIANQAQLQSALSEETNSFDTLKNSYTNMLAQINVLQQKQDFIYQQNSILSGALSAYNYQSNAVINAVTTELDVNKSYTSLLDKLKSDTSPIITPIQKVK